MATQSVRSMVSETSICNQALSWIGADPLESINEPNAVGEFCRNNYPFLRDAVLEERMWTFATTRQASTVADLAYDTPGLYRHSIPLEWLSVFRVYRDLDWDHQVDQWYREEDFIVADQPTVYMWGIKRVTDTGKFSNMFVQCLAARIAADLAVAIAQNRSLQADMWRLYEVKLEEAAARDGAQGKNERIRSSSLIQARVRGRSRALGSTV